MSVRVTGVAAPLAAMVLFASALAIEVRVHAQAAPAPPAAGQGRQGGAAQGGGGRGRGGRGIPAPLPPGRTAAPVDLTGNWVSVVTEDWEWRMMTPKKGDYASVPLNPAGVQAANAWDPSQDGRCEAYGVGGIMRMPTRLKISWQDDLTLKIETDAGQQTRLLHFTPQGGNAATAVSQSPRTLQGYSVADWQRSAPGFDAFMERGVGAPAPQTWGSLQVVTTNMLPGWLRRNGVPYSQNATISETFIRISHKEAGDWLVVRTVVDDPQYLQRTFITSSNFKKEPSDAKWSPMPCKS